MTEIIKPYRMVTDFVTGRKIPEVGAEGNRQSIERMLISDKGFDREDIEVDARLEFEIAGERYASTVDLVVSADGGLNRCMVFKCVPGSFGSCEKEIVAAARILDDRYQIPCAIVSDGKNAVVFDTYTGKTLGEGLMAIPNKAAARRLMDSSSLAPCLPERLDRERLIFRTYNCEYVNVAKNLPR